MVRYADLRDPDLFTEDERDWVSRRLLDLRAHMKSPPGIGIPSRTRNSSLIIGTWNLRDFDNNKYRHGPRRRRASPTPRRGSYRRPRATSGAR